MGWLIAAAALTLLGILPVGISAVYSGAGPLVRLLAGPVKITLYPRQKKKEAAHREKKSKSAKKPRQSGKKTPKQEKSGGSFRDFLPLVQTGLDFLDAFRRKLRVKRLEMQLTLAADDPCDLALNYGKAWAALGNLMPHLERAFVIKKRELSVACDFTAEKTLIFARLDLTITVGRALGLAVVYGIRVLRQYLNIMKLRKGGANS